MKITQHASLLPYNTFGINVYTDYFIAYESSTDLQAVLRSEIVKKNMILHIGEEVIYYFYPIIRA